MQEALNEIKNFILTTGNVEMLLDDEKFNQMITKYKLTEKDKNELFDFLEKSSKLIIEKEVEELENDESSIKENYDTYTDDSIATYLTEINKYPLLTDEEEFELFTKIKNKKEEIELLNNCQDKDIIEKKNEELRELKSEAANANLRLVISVAKRYSKCGMPFLDLIQEGNIGLLNAIDKYEVTKGFKFSTYATWWIRQAVTRAVADQSRIIRIPVHMNEKFARIHNLIKDNEAKGIFLTRSQVAEQLQLPEETVVFYELYGDQPVSLDTPIGEDEDTLLLDMISSDSKSAEDEVINDINHQLIMDLLDNKVKGINLKIKEQDKDVMIKRYGLDGNGPRTLDSIGQEYNVTKERIRQIQRRIEKKMIKNPRVHRYLGVQPTQAVIDKANQKPKRKSLH